MDAHDYPRCAARGYDPANIRILADGDQFGPTNYPTRENIMDSLKWLVASAVPGDYRFFHFSGHGVRRDSEKGKGKESRKVNEGQKPAPRDTERRWMPGVSAKSRLSSQNIPVKELVYYNEALVAQMSGGIHSEGTQGPPYLIHDSELNAHFAKLPPGSNLTVSPNFKSVLYLMNSRE
ncbi:unnamed protein product [Rhizoctonia solani]|uniref:Peptidase C14 caspase domain-containing protein n=1 Tax=Rhizoctonia solani TaxID=456999 RepID=A0A8H2X6S4_9AGAM|nr:unnamed protein product [Rhizoctonia solani]